MAEIKHLVNLNLNKNQLIKARVENLTSAPSTPVDGQIYFDTVLNGLFVYSDDITDWVDLTRTDLDITLSATEAVIVDTRAASSASFKATIPLADSTNAGLLSPGLFDKLDGLDASEVVSTASGNLVATNVQDALDELQGDIDTINSVKVVDIDITHDTDHVDVALKDGSGNVIDTDVIDEATASLAGVMSAADKVILDDLNTKKAAIYDNNGTPALLSGITLAELQTLLNFENDADVTDATTVDAAGAVMNTDTSTALMQFVIDEDDMASDLDTKVPTQQSVKAYVDNAITGGLNYVGAYNASTNTPDVEGGLRDTSSNTILKGDTFTVSVLGDFFTEEVQPGDMIVAEVDDANALADFTVVNKNIPDIVDASTTAKGLVELATDAENLAYTDTTRAVTAASMKHALGITGVRGGNNGTLFTTLTYSALVGNGSLTSIPVTHSIGNQFVQATLYDATTLHKVECEVVLTSATVTTLNFNVAPTSGQYRVVIVG